MFRCWVDYCLASHDRHVGIWTFKHFKWSTEEAQECYWQIEEIGKNFVASISFLMQVYVIVF